MVKVPLAAIAALTASSAAAQMPEMDILLDCTLRPIVEAGRPALPALAGGSSENRRVGWLLRGDRVSFLDPEDSRRIESRGDITVFREGDMLRSRVIWPQLLELGSSSVGGPNSTHLFDLVVDQIDLHQSRAEARVTVSEFVHGSGRDVVIGAFEGHCDLVTGRVAGQKFEEIG